MAKRGTTASKQSTDTSNTVQFPQRVPTGDDRSQRAVSEGADTPRQPVDASSASTRSDSMSSEPSEEAIRLRAYQRYLARGGADGMDLDDWVQAEAELKKGIKA